MQQKFRDSDFTERNLAQYHHHCCDIETAPNNETRKNLETTYGICKRSLLNRLPTFDVTMQLPQDLMHMLLGGSVQYEVRYILQNFIDNGFITLKQLSSCKVLKTYHFLQCCCNEKIVFKILMLQISKSIFKIRQWSLFSSHRKNWFTAHCKYMHLIKKNSQYTCYLERYSRFCEFCFGLHVCDWIISYSCFNVNISGTRWNYWETEKAILSFFENNFR